MMHARSISWRAVLAIAACVATCEGAAIGSISPPSEDALESYLESRDLSNLLAAQLRGRLATATGDARNEIAERLGRVYVRQMSAAKTPEERRVIEDAARELIESMPESSVFELRIDFAKTSYLRAEDLIERFRVRIVGEAQLQEADRLLRLITPQFQEIATRVGHRIELLERKEAGARQDDLEETKAQLADARRVRSLAQYYAGWCGYYGAMLSSNKGAAMRAMQDFGWLLNSGGGKVPEIDRVPGALLKYEHVARAAVGVAMCASLRDNDVEALRWLDLVESTDGISPALRAELLSRRMVVLGGAKRWSDLELLLKRRAADRKKDRALLTPSEARLLAVLALDAASGDGARPGRAQIETLAQIALAELVSQGRVADVLDIVNRYGTNPIGQDGFIVVYVRGLQSYERAREAHRKLDPGATDPVKDDAAANLYRQAAEVLAAATVASDALRYANDSGRASMLRGLALFYAGDLSRAAEIFTGVGNSATDAKLKEEALWYAIVSLDRAVEDGKKSLVGERDRVATLFLTTFPASPNAAKLLLRRAGDGLIPDARVVDILLATPGESPMFEAARRQAAFVLFRMQRRAPGDRVLTRRFMDVATEALSPLIVQCRLSPKDTELPTAALRLVRQIAEVGLSASPPEVNTVERVLAQWTDLADELGLGGSGAAEELAYRRLQIGLVQGDVDGAVAAFDKLGPSQFRKSAERLLYKHAVKAWEGQPRSVEAARGVVRFGVPVAEQLVAGDPAFQQPVTLGVCNDVAAAAAIVFEEAKDLAMRDAAIKIDRRSFEGGTPSATAVRRLARLSEHAGDAALALQCWQRILGGVPGGSGDWFEARYESLRLIAASEPEKARQICEQFRVLYPDWGSKPWNEKIREIAVRLGVVGASGASEGAAGRNGDGAGNGGGANK